MKNQFVTISFIALIAINFISCRNKKEESASSSNPMELRQLTKNIKWANRTIHRVKLDVTKDTRDMDNNMPEVQYKVDTTFVNLIFDGIWSGKLKAYLPIELSKKHPMTIDEVKELGHGIDSVSFLDPVTRKETIKVIERYLDRNAIQKFKIVEDWFYDSEKNKMESRIIACAPILNRYDDHGDFLAEEILFWVFF